MRLIPLITDKASSSEWGTRLTDVLVDCIHRAYRRWAFFIVDHSIAVIVFCVLATVVCTAKMATTPYVLFTHALVYCFYAQNSFKLEVTRSAIRKGTYSPGSKLRN